MEYLSTCITDRMCTTNVISESDKEFYAYSVQLLLEKTIGIILICLFAAVFRKLFEVVAFEKLTRKNAQSSKVYPEAPWPICPVILHQPKRPKN